jgi:signal transduction histidine kinase
LKIRTKVTLWYTALLAVLLAAVLAFLLRVGGKLALSGSESVLRSVTEEMAGEVELENGAVETDDDFRSTSRGVFIAVFYQSKLAAGQVPEDLGRLPDFAAGTLRTAGAYLVYDLAGEDGLAVRGFFARESTAESQRGITLAALAAAPVLLLIAALGGLAITGRAFRPIEEIARTAAQIGAGRDLSRRIELPDTRDEVSALGGAFNGMMDRLERSFAAEKQFSSDVSHELRTPVAVIQSQCEYALAGGAEGDVRRALLEIRSRTGEMAVLIARLLELSRAENRTAEVVLEPVELSELAETVTEELAPQAEQKRITLRLCAPEPVTVRGEQTLILRLMLNLAGNAVRYTPEGGEVTLSVSGGKDGAVLAVRDNGIGIPQEHLDKIFNRFYRVDASRHRDGDGGSFGLGLALCKWIADVHGASISVRSAPGRGSEFTVKFPAWPPDGASPGDSGGNGA